MNEFLVFLSTFFSISLIFVSFLAGKFYQSRKEKVVLEQKVSRGISDIKRRAAFEALAAQGDLDEIIVVDDEYEDLVSMTEDVTYKFFERQSRHFLECALNLMAHSYKSLEEARKDAVGILEIAFEEDIILTHGTPKDDGENLNV